MANKQKNRRRRGNAPIGLHLDTANRTSGLGYTIASPPTNDDLRQGYTGYQKDDESGLDYAQARYYNYFTVEINMRQL